MGDTSALYMEIFTRLPMAGLLVNVSGRPNFVANHKFLSMIGYSEEEFYSVMGSNYIRIFDERDILSLRESLREARVTHSTVSQELLLINRQGNKIYTIIEAEATERNDGDYYLCSLLDVSQLKQVQLELQNEQRRLNTIIECTNDIIYEYELKTDTMRFYDSQSFRNIGQSQCLTLEHYSTAIREEKLVHPEDAGKLIPLCMGKEYGHIEIRVRRPNSKDTHYYWYEMLGTLLYDDENHPYMSVGVLRDIDESKQKTLGFKQMAERDSLTQLFNHNSVKAQVEAYFDEGGKDKINALILIDLDDFKSVNDTFGHRFGDEVLQKTAEMLLETFGANDIVGRIGGDEYLVFCKDMLEMTAIQEKLERLYAVFAATEIGNKEKYHVRASVGVAVSANGADSYKRLFDMADRSMYKVKRSGKNTYAFRG